MYPLHGCFDVISCLKYFITLQCNRRMSGNRQLKSLRNTDLNSGRYWQHKSVILTQAYNHRVGSTCTVPP